MTNSFPYIKPGAFYFGRKAPASLFFQAENIVLSYNLLYISDIGQMKYNDV